MTIKSILIVLVVLTLFLLPSYILGRWMIFMEIRKTSDIRAKEKGIIITMAIFGGLLFLYPSFIASTTFGDFLPMLILDFLNISVTETIVLPFVIISILVLFTIVNMVGVILGKGMGKLIIQRSRKAT